VAAVPPVVGADEADAPTCVFGTLGRIGAAGALGALGALGTLAALGVMGATGALGAPEPDCVDGAEGGVLGCCAAGPVLVFVAD